MDINAVSESDLSNILALVKDVADRDVLPLLNAQGRSEFNTRVLSDIETTLNASTFTTVKAVIDGQIVGYGAFRNGNYLTHLFVSKSCQGYGIGKALLTYLLNNTAAIEVNLRSSVNAVSFYERNGFVVSGDESELNGIRFIPMRLVRMK
ncbi:GNAT family N-acetyltransferase [Vibrio sp. TH_r3]|uniref:GNAT family N-acetyltransferase n=1 Tax=unclassified Vibrio TaxID=2614977 RepID=UPI00295337C7|nr:GNAT family N-acetyltransferase [Vibrio sp. TH_r3]MDV7104894.1 GNAT family N-acetyltransferase [Vibrio sp. TH_r3]